MDKSSFYFVVVWIKDPLVRVNRRKLMLATTVGAIVKEKRAKIEAVIIWFGGGLVPSKLFLNLLRSSRSS